MHAERLRFAEEPTTAVRFPGTGERESTSHSDRTRLPDRIVPGEEYRDVTVAYRLATRLTGPEDGRSGSGSVGVS
ncbi:MULTISPECIES: hypothetical protein [Streptomyces]|uniref:Uncharacterized protein n=1 Tax=Streptomyces canarius TaxID=285453 RepID=A0ABQ3CX15_9ACTN|nr:hypothetical protein [Streptomyces canarius]GHA48050.1 hypothetical protein GCM10010345_60660 [Streptomyces canarius]